MKTLLVFSLLLLVSACATQPPQQTALSEALWQTHRQQLAQLDEFQLNGRLGVKTADDSWTVNVIWQQHPQQYELRFTAPMGQGAMLLEGTPRGVVLRTSDKKVYRAANPDALMAEVLELPLPVTYLYHWVRGLPAPEVAITEYLTTTNGFLYRLQQAGWTIEFDRYQTVQTVQLPGRLWLSNDQFEARFAISEWQVEAIPPPANVLEVRK
jgi:outer membrane lipoprotein LolB